MVVRSGAHRRAAPVISSIVDAYSATARAWADGPTRVYSRLATALVGCSPVPLEGREILDVGAGTGAGGQAALAAGARGVVAVDAAIGMLSYGAVARPSAAAGDALALPFRGNVFDGALAAFSLNHLDDPVQGFREMARVVRPRSPVLAATYASDDTHPVKQAVEDALLGWGWAPEAWYERLRNHTTPLLATEQRCHDAATAAGLDPVVQHLAIGFDDLTPVDLVEWRLGMAQHASFVGQLSDADHDRLVADVIARLPKPVPPLVRSVLVVAALTD